MNSKLIFRRFMLTTTMIVGICWMANADNCSGGQDCNGVPSNNTGAHIIGGVMATGALIGAIYNGTRKEKEDEKGEISLKDFFLPEKTDPVEPESETIPEDEKNKEKPDKDKSDSKYFDAPLGNPD